MWSILEKVPWGAEKKQKDGPVFVSILLTCVFLLVGKIFFNDFVEYVFCAFELVFFSFFYPYYSKPEPKPGDLIEIFRPMYSHWAIYVGDGYVIHLAPPSEFAGAGAASIMSALTDKAIVKKELLCDVAGRDKYKVNNKHDSQYTPLPPSKIIQIAEELVGKEVLYKLTSENCEHFVNEIRYGVARSDQMRKQKFLELKSSDFGRSFHPTNLSEFSNLCRVFLAVSCVANVGLESRDSRSQILSCSLSVLGTEPGVLSMTRFLCVALEPFLDLDQAGLKLTEICLALPPECWD
ncbi:hypothetical protein STEG23_033769 [Scotinomys teguina]